MKKVISLLCAATIVSLPLNAYVQAAEGDQTTVVDQTNGENKTQETSTGLEQVAKLTLDDVIKRGTENSSSLAVLQLNLEATKNQLLDTQFIKGDTAWDLKDLDDRLDDLKDQRDNLTDTASKIANGSQRIAIQDSIDAIEEQIQTLELNIKKLEAGQIQLQLQEVEAKEGVRLLLTSAYTNIVLLQEQINFTNKAINSAKTDVYKAQRMYNLGTASKDDLRQAKVAQTNLEKQLEQQEKNYKHDLAKLSFDIGVVYNPSIEIQQIEYKAVKSVKPESYSSLIDHSYKVQKAQKSLETAQIERDDVYREYKENDSIGTKVSTYKLEQYDKQVKVAEETVASTKDDVETAIEKLYLNEDISYLGYEEALRKLANVQTDVSNLKKRYKLGFISKYDYNKALIQLDQAKLNVYTATVQNFMTKEQIKALENGYVQ